MHKTGFSVIHLSTGHMGGAGLAARRLSQQLNEHNVDSKFYALEHHDFQPNHNEFSIKRTPIKRLASGVLSLLNAKLSDKVFFSPLSLNVMPKNFSENIIDKKGTILHIHNWFNLLNFKEIARLSNLGFPIVMTLHDQRTMTGGCHYSFSCVNFKHECETCPLLASGSNQIPKLVWKKTKKSISEINQKFALIAPSEWILAEARQSSLLKDFTIKFIPNTLGTNLLTIESVSRNTNKPLRLGVASINSDSYIKGGDLIKDLEDFIISRNLPFEFTFLNRFPNNAFGVKAFWGGIDYLLVLSRAENSPNVIHEAKQAGIPVIASKDGGITELLSEGFDFGLDETDLNSEKITKLLFDISKISKSNEGIIRMQKQFTEYTKRSLPEHIELYMELIRKP